MRVLDRALVDRPRRSIRARASLQRHGLRGEARQLELEPGLTFLQLDRAAARTEGVELGRHVERDESPPGERQHVREGARSLHAVHADRPARQRPVAPAVAPVHAVGLELVVAGAALRAQGVKRQVGEAHRDLERRPEPWGHVVMRLVDRAPTDRVVRVVAEQLPPGVPELALRIPESRSGQHRQRAQGLGRLERPLTALVGLLERHARGVDATQDIRPRAAGQLALEGGQLAGLPLDGVGVVGEPSDLRLDVGLERPQVGEDLGQVVLEPRVVVAVAEEEVAKPGVGEHVPLGAQDVLDAVGGVGAAVFLRRAHRMADRRGRRVVDRLR